MSRLLPAFALLLAVWALGAVSAPRAHSCAFAVVPTTYEGSTDRGIYLIGTDLAAYNHIAPQDTFFGIPRVETGPRGSRTVASESYVPPKLLKAIAWIESNLWQADYSVPYEGVGPALISFDCGHGLMQVTTGMTTPQDGYQASKQQSLVATHHLYNIARGSAILVDKWNYAPEGRPVVGNSDPRILEDWYYAVWSYNGFASSNNPLTYADDRSAFSCSADLNDGYSHNRGLHPYQELVFGCASRPPSVDGLRLWAPQPITLPNLNNPTWRGPISNFPDSSRMDFPTPWINNRDPTPPRPAGTRALLLGSPALRLSSTRITANTGSVTISNAGSGIMSWRVTPEQTWIRVNKQAGVALGPYVPCGAPCERQPAVTIRVDTTRAPPTGTGRVRFESLTTGEVRWVDVVRNQPTPPPGDSDWDGCKDERELGNDPLLGGQRDPSYFWDFFDTPDENNVRDGQISGTDLFRVLARFGSSGALVMPVVPPNASGYHTAFDRGPPRSGRPWDASMADGTINGIDIFVLMSQLGHNCS